tara:strand:- start:1093 stop:1209 length:117 start_codon:yes stop_codon:yes gene_type:complete
MLVAYSNLAPAVSWSAYFAEQVKKGGTKAISLAKIGDS